MSIEIRYPVQVAENDWENYIYELADDEVIEWIIDNKSKEEIIELMKDGWDKKSDKEKQELISGYEYAGPDWFYKDGTKEINFEALFDNDPKQSVEELVFEVLDQIEDDIQFDYQEAAKEDYENGVAWEKEQNSMPWPFR